MADDSPKGAFLRRNEVYLHFNPKDFDPYGWKLLKNHFDFDDDLKFSDNIRDIQVYTSELSFDDVQKCISPKFRHCIIRQFVAQQLIAQQFTGKKTKPAKEHKKEKKVHKTINAIYRPPASLWEKMGGKRGFPSYLKN
jgi:hypothetical protein